jgi:hypothetical protein
MFSPTVSESNSAPLWNTMVTFLRISRSCGLGVVGDVLVGHKDRPLSGLRKPMMWPRLTDLPTPLRPMMASVSPALDVKIGID